MIRAFRLSPIILAVAMNAAFAQNIRDVPETRTQLHLSFAPLVEMTAPAVVNIFARKVIKPEGTPPAFGDTALWRLFSDALLFGYGARERIENSLGSGVIVGADGTIVTNHHVIENAEGIVVGLADDRTFAASVLLSDKRTDLAVLRIEPFAEELPVLKFGDSDRLNVGDLVLAIGNPFGVGQTVTSGIISALARTGVGITDFRFFIQTDAAINPGNSGGAQVDMMGNLVGINTAIFSRSGGSQGIGFAIPSNMVRTVVEAAIRGRKLIRPWFGVSGQPVPPQLAYFYGIPPRSGVFVTEVHPMSPAAKAGIVVGDILMSLGNYELPNFEALRYRIATRLAGDSLRVTLIRGGEPAAVTLDLEEPPTVPASNTRWLPGIHFLSGARVASLSPSSAEELGLDSAITGVVVLEVRRASAAAKFGLQRGDVIRGFDDTQVATVAQLLAQAPTPFKKWFLKINRGGGTLLVEGG